MDHNLVTKFLIELNEELKYLPKNSRKSIVNVYAGKINVAFDYGEEVADIINKLPSPSEIAKEIYKQEGIDYINKRMKVIRRKEIFEGITSIILIIFVTLATICIAGYASYLIYNKFYLIGQLFSTKIIEMVVMIILVLAYILISIIAIIYLIDLSLIINAFLWEKAHKLFPKKKIKDNIFTINNWFDKLLKQKNVLAKSFGILIAIVIVMAIISFTTKTYVYNSLKGHAQGNEITYNVDSNIETIRVYNYEANVKIINGDEFSIISNSEFNHGLNILKEANVLTITSRASLNYDFLGLLKEPVQDIIIVVPSFEDVNKYELCIERGSVNIDGISLDNLYIDTYLANIRINESNINNLVINDTVKTDVGKTFNVNFEGGRIEVLLQKSIINNIETSINRGAVKIIDNEIDNLNIVSKGADIGLTDINKTLENSEYSYEFGKTVALEYLDNTAKINMISGTLVFDQVTFKDFTFEGSSTTALIKKSFFEKSKMTMLGSANTTIQESVLEDTSIEYNYGSLILNMLNTNMNITKCLGNITAELITGDLDIDVKNGNIIIFDVCLNNFNAILSDSSKVQIYNVGANNINIETNKTNNVFDQIYGTNMVVRCKGGTTVFSNDKKNRQIEENKDLVKYSYIYRPIENLTITSNININEVETINGIVKE